MAGAKIDPNGPYWVYMNMRERELLTGALETYKGNVRRVAAALGVEKSFIYNRLRALGMQARDFRDEYHPGHPGSRPKGETS